ncbi:MAG: hypothetical protein MJ188_02280 [Treponema sp.]|nr:hypothetical protein [Treponema sp.]
MPGLKQLKQFEKDILSIGDELTLRASRGEKPVRVPIPKNIQVEDDSEDFVLGMPEEPLIHTTESTVDDDLSEITGIVTGARDGRKQTEEAEQDAFAAPDLSSLLAPMDFESGSQESEMPDLSMFMDNAPEENEIQPEEPQKTKEVSVADMGLEALLAGAGFDGSEGANQEDLLADDEFTDSDDDDFFNNLEKETQELDKAASFEDTSANNSNNDFGLDLPPEIAEIFAGNNNSDSSTPEDFNSDIDNSVLNLEQSEQNEVDNLLSDIDFDEPSFQNENDFSEDFSNALENGFNDDSFGSTSLDFDAPSPTDFENPSDAQTDFAADDFELPAMNTDMPVDSDFGTESEADFNLNDLDSEDFAIPDNSDFETVTNSDFDTSNMDAANVDMSDIDVPDFGATDLDNSTDSSEDFESVNLDDFDFNFDDDNASNENTSSENAMENAQENQDSISDSITEDITDSFNEGQTDNFDSDFFDDATETSTEGPADFGDSFENVSFEDTPDFSSDLGESDTPDGLFSQDDIVIPSENGSFSVTTEDISDLAFDNSASSDDNAFSNDSFDFDNDSTGEIPDFADEINSDSFDNGFGSDGFGDDSFDTTGMDSEVFDTTGMEDMDFDAPSLDSGFDDSDNGDFEIPGFSDVSISQDIKSSSRKPADPDLDVPDFSQGMMGVELPPNTLDDEHYEIFMKNFKEYPLNVRLAFEDLIVQNEFTDDAEFEVIEKILNKAPARQVAGQLEKMLDISIPVPRDFEHRSASEYEAYKKSLQYQIRNKILPIALVACVLGLVSWGLFNFVKNCIYIPAKATNYYKQGYVLLENDEYPLSQMKFDQAASLKMKKNWFFKYAQGYKDHKQYQRSAEMYLKILKYFNHDKQAGLEYASMELNELSNYKMAEEIVKRQILDYHVNDPDGMLMLGDTYLEWGTEKDSSKLNLAKEQYYKLLQLYGDKDIYNARLMKYYIRSDNLKEVLGYQKRFEDKKHQLSGEDCTELGGYLLEKLYGPLTPAEEPLRYKIEGLRKLLIKAVTDAPENPVAHYNLANYYINTNDVGSVQPRLTKAIEKFNNAKQLSSREVFKFIDSYRLLGENYLKTGDYLQAQEQYTKGITLYTAEKENAGFKGNEKIGKLYADLADLNYLQSGDYENASINYKHSIELGYDNPAIRYRLGFINYKKKNYQDALSNFMKAGEGNIKENNLLLALANTLCLRDDDYAAEGYYEQLMNNLETTISIQAGTIFPQSNVDQFDLITAFMTASNNYGVVLHKLAKRTGDSGKNALAIIQFQQSLRAWDSLTRNQQTMVRLEGSNLAEENIKYVTHPISEFEPSIYLDIPKTLSDLERL